MQSEGDQAKLKALYNEMNKLLLAEAFNLEISTNPALSVTSSKVREIVSTANNWWVFSRTSLA